MTVTERDKRYARTNTWAKKKTLEIREDTEKVSSGRWTTEIRKMVIREERYNTKNRRGERRESRGNCRREEIIDKSNIENREEGR